MRYVLPALLLFLAFFPIPIFPEDKSDIAYIDLKFVFENSNLKNRLYREFLSQKDRVSERIRALGRKIRDEQLALAALQPMLGAKEFLLERNKVEKKLKQYEDEIAKAKKDVASWESENMAILFDEIINVLTILSKEEGIKIFLSRQSAMVYGDSALDYTQRVIDLINEIDERNTPSAK